MQPFDDWGGQRAAYLRGSGGNTEYRQPVTHIANISRHDGCSGASRYQTRVSGGALDVLVRPPLWISGNTRCTRGEERVL